MTVQDVILMTVSTPLKALASMVKDQEGDPNLSERAETKESLPRICVGERESSPR